MKCNKCGSEMAEGAKFCANCGNNVEWQTMALDESVMPENMASEGVIPENTVSESVMPENTASEDVIPEAVVEENIITENEIPVMACPHCGNAIDSQTVFCGFCGNNVSEPAYVPEQTNAPAAAVCEKCGAYLVEGAAFCGNCGNVIGGNYAPQASVPQAEEPVYNQANEPAYSNEAFQYSGGYVEPALNKSDKPKADKGLIILLAILAVVVIIFAVVVVFAFSAKPAAPAMQAPDVTDARLLESALAFIKA